MHLSDALVEAEKLIRKLEQNFLFSFPPHSHIFTLTRAANLPSGVCEGSLPLHSRAGGAVPSLKNIQFTNMRNMSLSHRPHQNTNNDQTPPPTTVFMWQLYYPRDQNRRLLVCHHLRDPVTQLVLPSRSRLHFLW